LKVESFFLWPFLSCDVIGKKLGGFLDDRLMASLLNQACNSLYERRVEARGLNTHFYCVLG
jgi:hypothetical protein